MNKILILGGGTAGTMLANTLVGRLGADWQITVIDADNEHVYQPGLLFLPFSSGKPPEIVRSRRAQLLPGVHLTFGEVDLVDPDAQTVRLTDGLVVEYDHLVIATGTAPCPDQTPGMLGDEWRRSIFDFYTPAGARALAKALHSFTGGRLVVHIAETPIKCPVAPLEFAFLADAYLRDRGIREVSTITYVTPLDGAFTRPVAARHLAGMLDRRHIGLEPDFLVERVDPERRVLVSYDEREVPFDLLVTVPVNMGAEFVARSGLGDELNYVRVDPHTFVCVDHDNVYALGDAADLPTSKAGSVAHFAVESFVEDFLARLAGTPAPARFDGHANCFVESGDGKALLLDFNYDTEPLPGSYPLPVVGPMSLLHETRRNHVGKLAFRWIYWHLLLPGHRLPVPTRMSMSGKRRPVEAEANELTRTE